jgi:hypothetical protein
MKKEMNWKHVFGVLAVSSMCLSIIRAQRPVLKDNEQVIEAPRTGTVPFVLHQGIVVPGTSGDRIDYELQKKLWKRFPEKADLRVEPLKGEDDYQAIFGGPSGTDWTKRSFIAVYGKLPKSNYSLRIMSIKMLAGVRTPGKGSLNIISFEYDYFKRKDSSRKADVPCVYGAILQVPIPLEKLKDYAIMVGRVD